MIAGLILELGPSTPHTVSSLYQTLRSTVDALDGDETGQREPQRSQRDAKRKDLRSKLRHD